MIIYFCKIKFFHYFCSYKLSGNSSVGRASASQAEGREFEPRFPLNEKIVFVTLPKKWKGFYFKCNIEI